jgi:hypothetical protein
MCVLSIFSEFAVEAAEKVDGSGAVRGRPSFCDASHQLCIGASRGAGVVEVAMEDIYFNLYRESEGSFPLFSSIR